MSNESKNQASLAWVEYDPKASKKRRAGVCEEQRRVVRAHVAHTSWDARRATTVRKEPRAKATRPRGTPEAQAQAQAQADKIAQDSISRLLSRLRSRDAHAVASMAQKSDRILLWNAFTGGTLCFEAAIFIAGTHVNTCGISPHELSAGYGTGILYLRGALLDSIQKSIIRTPNDGFNSISLALLAGWERRFGDHRSYEVHIQAWKNLPLAVGSLEDSGIATLTDVAMTCFQEATQERYNAELAFSLSQSLSSGTVLPEDLPPGFSIMPTDRPEALSLLSTVTNCATLDYTAKNSIANMRKLVIEIMSWSASHSVSVTPNVNYENQWDNLQLNACHHIRSAMISANAPVMEACLRAHNASWELDVQAGIDIHADSCRHSKTHELIGTRYHDLAIWAKMTLNSHATPTQSGDEHMNAIMKHSGIAGWEQMESLLEKFVYRKELSSGKYQKLFDRLSSIGLA
ncbi:hypothetical protein E4T44_09833 [Aureobasidium sp. EXF-8845]|nr:hypothetical protein E4T44_09833 [Aureobasidium sp. EXF-8845]KAI4838623.1 hypothetical protein E4T45_09711 [Aureobasidium sp. EXF-8846]